MACCLLPGGGNVKCGRVLEAKRPLLVDWFMDKDPKADVLKTE